MKPFKNTFSIAVTCLPLVALLFALSCKQKTTTSPKISFDEKFKSLFYADSGGLTGADGIFSVPLPDGSSVFFLGDCFLGKVTNNSRNYNTPMLRNAFNVINKEQTKAKAIVNGNYGNPQTLLVPVNAPGDSTYRWYWPGHGFVKNDTLYVFALNLYNEPTAKAKIGENGNEQGKIDELTENMAAFRISQIDLLSFTLPDFKYIETRSTPFCYKENQIDFGNCVMVDSGFVYIFGTQNLPGFSKIHVARVPLNSKNFSENWEYSTGKGWDNNIRNSKPIEIDVSVSEQFSIFRYGNKYILLTQERAGTDIYTYTSSSPEKGYSNKRFIYHTPDCDLDSTKTLFTYNALAHVQYIKNNQLLVSYCINSLNVRSVFDNVENYRAQFLRIPMEMILNE
ncbi:MAG: hypothetical protein AB7S54_08080 [Bacteroidales bacterium]